MPRFKSENFLQNRTVLEEFVRLADEVGCTPGQLALAWLLNRAPHIVPIPGTRSVAHFDENMGAVAIRPDREQVELLDRLFAVGKIAGDRYPPATQAEIDTEQFS
jgi:aryl-alcohol dehydrogenase-like predicted oxidoreductase